MSTPNNPGTLQSDPQLDESIRISHLEPMRGDEKKLGFPSFGHWAEVPGSRVPSAAESLPPGNRPCCRRRRHRIGWRVLPRAPLRPAAGDPLPAALCQSPLRPNASTLGTGVIDMRYENPLYLAEELAAKLDHIADGRIAIGVSRGAPEVASVAGRHLATTLQKVM